MPFATIRTGPHSSAQGEVIDTLPCGRVKISLCNGHELIGLPIVRDDAAHSDDQDHDMTPLMERRDD